MKNWLAFAIGGVLAAGVVWFLMSEKQQPEPVAAVEVAQQVPQPAVTPEPAPPAVSPAPAPVRKTVPRVDPKPAPPPPAPVVESSAPAPAPEPPAPPPPVVKEVKKEEPPPPPPAPKVPRTVKLAEGTLIPVRLVERVSSETHQAGDSFLATLDQALVVDGLVIADKGSRVEGRVATSDKGGRVRGVAMIALELTRINTADGQKIAVRTASFEKEAEKETKKDAAKVGLGAGIGAAIGAIAGGGRGAAIGAAAGGAAGTGAVLGTRGEPAELAVETRISFRLSSAVSVTEKLD